MFQWFLNLFKRKELDPILSLLYSTEVFYRVVNSSTDKYGKTYCGFKRIAHLCTILDSSQNGLRMFLRVYRSPKKPYNYIFIYSFADNNIKDALFNTYHISFSPFSENGVVDELEKLLNTTAMVKALYMAKTKKYTPATSSL